MAGHRLAVVLLSVFFGQINCHKNNVCSTYNDYFNIENSTNCWYDPDVIGDTVQILKNHNYPVEIYNVTTQDGYILTLHRIPRKNAKEVIMFGPPMTGTGASFLKSGNASLGFVMYEAGYDVWLSNFRGSVYSTNHTFLNQNQTKYWDYSFHEIGIYDFPAELELIKKVTKRSDVIVITYSMSGTAAMTYASLLPRHASEHVKVIIPLGPSIYGNPKSYIGLGVINVDKVLVNKGSKVTAFSSYEMAKNFLYRSCVDHRMKFLCIIFGTTNAGGTPDNFNPALVPLLYSNLPSRISIKLGHHYLQLFKVHRFRAFDYGPVANMMRYNSATPPDYPLNNISVPIYIIYGESDQSCTVETVEELFKSFSAVGRKFGKHMVKKYNHLDFMFAKTCKTEVGDHILNFIKEHF